MKKVALIISAVLLIGVASEGANAANQPSYNVKKVAAKKIAVVKKKKVQPVKVLATSGIRFSRLVVDPTNALLETPTVTPTPTPTPTPAPAPTPTPTPTPAPDANALLIAKLFELVNTLIAEKQAPMNNVVTTVNPVINVAPTTVAQTTVAPVNVVAQQAPAPAPVVIIAPTPARVDTRTATVHVEGIETSEHHG